MPTLVNKEKHINQEQVSPQSQPNQEKVDNETNSNEEENVFKMEPSEFLHQNR